MKNSDIETINLKLERRWDKAAISLKNHQNYLANKLSRFPITLIDLLYISNFKGGNGTINEIESHVNEILEVYSDLFLKIENSFKLRALGDLNSDEINNLIENVDSVMELTKNRYRIDGFNVSRLSALLHSYFPNLIPIIDRRTLSALNLLEPSNFNLKTGQVTNWDTLYASLIKKIAVISKENQKIIREIDKELFIQEMIKSF